MELYQASQIKRHRATRAELEERRDALFDIVADMRPMTVRQVFYQATVRGIVEKTENGYAKVQTDLAEMRRDGASALWLARRQHALAAQAADLQRRRGGARPTPPRFYRKALWNDADSYVEIWLEKDALSGVVYPVTNALRRAADGGARLCLAVVPPHRRRSHQ